MRLAIMMSLLATGCGGGNPAGPSPVGPVSTCENVQWSHLGLVPARGADGRDFAGVLWLGTNTLEVGQSFPYTVPAGHYLGVSSALLAAKKVVTEPRDGSYASYLNVNCTPGCGPYGRLLSLDTYTGYARFSPPLTLPAGAVVSAVWLNNAREPQWMGATLTGYLSSDPSFSACNFSASTPRFEEE